MPDQVRATILRIASEAMAVFPQASFTEDGEFFTTPIGSLYKLEIIGGTRNVGIGLLRTVSSQRVRTVEVPLLDAFQLEYSNWEQNVRDWLVGTRKQIISEVSDVLTDCNVPLSSQALNPVPPSNVPRLRSMLELVHGCQLVVVMGKTASGKSTVIRNIIRDLQEITRVVVWTVDDPPAGMHLRLFKEYPELETRTNTIEIMFPPEGMELQSGPWMTQLNAWLVGRLTHLSVLVLMGSPMTHGIDWRELHRIALERQCMMVVEVQAHREATSLDALSRHPEMAKEADLVVWVDQDKPLNVIKDRNGKTGPFWGPLSVTPKH